MKRRVLVSEIQRQVAAEFRVPVQELRSQTRSQEMVRPRYAAIKLSAEFTSLSKSHIGRLFGGRDHATIFYALDRVDDFCEADPDFEKRLNRLRSRLSREVDPEPTIQLSFLHGPLFDWSASASSKCEHQST